MNKVVAEFFGTAFLLMIIVGSGIMAQNLSPQNEAIVLLANSLATGLGLFVLINLAQDVSGAHFNPLVSVIEFLTGRLKSRELAVYIAAQCAGAVMGVFLAHIVFDLSLLQVSDKSRGGLNLFVSEIIATFGLLSVVILKKGAASVAAYITSAYWFTSSTSFANPAVTFARSLTDTFCGIASGNVSIFILAQILGMIFSYLLLRNKKTGAGRRTPAP